MLPVIPAMPLSSIVPVGSIIAFAGDIGNPVSSPPGEQDYTTNAIAGNPVTDNIEGMLWMVCDGRELYCAAYPQLFNTIGFLYSQKGDPYAAGFTGTLPKNAMFRIPDYRGYFLRGVDGTATIDPDTTLRQLSDKTTSNKGVGTIQTDALQDHWHVYSMTEAPGTTGDPSGTAVVSPTMPAITSPPTNSPSAVGGQNTVRTSTETRAINFSVHYLIKYA